MVHWKREGIKPEKSQKTCLRLRHIKTFGIKGCGAAPQYHCVHSGSSMTTTVYENDSGIYFHFHDSSVASSAGFFIHAACRRRYRSAVGAVPQVWW